MSLEGESSRPRSEYVKLDEGDYEIDVLIGSRKIPPEEGPETDSAPEEGYEGIVYTIRGNLERHKLDELTEKYEKLDGAEVDGRQQVTVGLPYENREELENNYDEARRTALNHFREIRNTLAPNSSREAVLQDSAKIAKIFRNLAEEEN